MKSDSVKRNIELQFAYQFVILVIPLIVAPFLTRTLGESSLGIYTYTYSVAYYFVLFCMLGIAKHGQRVIAERKDNDVLLRKAFWSLLTLHIMISLLGFCAYVCFSLLLVNKYKSVFIVQSLYVLSALFDITWVFYGIEKFRVVVVRNAFVKLLEMLVIIMLVRNPDDLIKYTLIMSVSALLSNALLIPIATKSIKPIKFDIKVVCEHIKPLLVLSVAVFAISMFTVFDKTLLGIMTTAENVAFYEYSNKIINIPKMFIVVVGTVLFPRSCNCFANNDLDGVKKYYRYSLFVVYFIGFGSLFGLLSISDLFTLIYYGESFATCGTVIKTLAPIILIIGLGDIIRSQFLIPLKLDLKYTFCVIINAVINIVLSFLFIPKLGIYGAVIGTMSAEIFGLFFQGCLVRKYIDIKSTIRKAVPFIVSGMLMSAIVEIVKLFLNSSLVDLIVQVLVGVFIYVATLCSWFLFFDNKRDINRRIVLGILKHANQR